MNPLHKLHSLFFDLPQPDELKATRLLNGQRRHVEDEADHLLYMASERLAAERTHYQLLLDLESAQAHYEELKVREKIARQRKMRLNREI